MHRLSFAFLRQALRARGKKVSRWSLDSCVSRLLRRRQALLSQTSQTYALSWQKPIKTGVVPILFCRLSTSRNTALFMLATAFLKNASDSSQPTVTSLQSAAKHCAARWEALWPSSAPPMPSNKPNQTVSSQKRRLQGNEMPVLHPGNVPPLK